MFPVQERACPNMFQVFGALFLRLTPSTIPCHRGHAKPLARLAAGAGNEPMVEVASGWPCDSLRAVYIVFIRRVP